MENYKVKFKVVDTCYFSLMMNDDKEFFNFGFELF